MDGDGGPQVRLVRALTVKVSSHGEHNKDTPDRGIAEFILAKQRNGPTGLAKLAFLASYTRFENLAFEYSDAA